MDDRQKKLKDIEIENFIWIIYIVIIFMSWYANSVEKKFLLYNDEKSRREYQNMMILIFTILFFVYLYFAKDSYDTMKELNEYDTEKKKILVKASFIGSLLILISGIIFLGIAITDDQIETEIAFN